MSGRDHFDKSTDWSSCGSICCHDAVTRTIFIRFNQASNSTELGKLFELLLIDPGMPSRMWSGQMPTIAEVLDAIFAAGVFTREEQTDFAKTVESLARVESESGSPASGANQLFDELLGRGLAGWRLIGSRSGSSVIGWFDTLIYARQCGDGPTWAVVERGEQGNGDCIINDDGSGRSIFAQFIAQYYEEEIDQHGDA